MQWPNFNWAPFSFCGPQLSSSSFNPVRTAGFIGFGRISQATLSRLIPFGFTRCLFTGNPNSTGPSSVANEVQAKYSTLKEVRRVSLDELAKESDQACNPELGRNLWNLSERIVREKAGADALLPWDAQKTV